MTVSGSLALPSGAIYLVQVNPATSSFAKVTGTATLGGATVNAIFAPGSYVAKQYTILTAGSVSGTFGTLVNTNLPSGFQTRLSYDATHAYLEPGAELRRAARQRPQRQPAECRQRADRFLQHATAASRWCYGGLTAAG